MNLPRPSRHWRKRSTACWAIEALAVVLLASTPVLAVEVRPSTFDTISEEGRQALASARFDDALCIFERAQVMAAGDEESGWRALLGLGLTYENLGRLPEAVAAYRGFLARSEALEDGLTAAWRDKRAIVLETVEQLHTRLMATHALVTVESNPPGAVVAVDGRPEGGLTPASVYVLAGSHELGLRREGHRREKQAIAVSAGEHARVAVALTSYVQAVAPAPDPGPGPGPWLLLSGGGALVVAGGLFTWLSFEDAARANRAGEDYVDNDDREAAYDAWNASKERHQVVSGVLYGVGGAALAGAIVWLVVDALDSGGADSADSEVVWGAGPTPGGFSAQLTAGF